MDVGAPSNWERIEHLFGGTWNALRRGLRWGSRTTTRHAETIRDLDAHGYLGGSPRRRGLRRPARTPPPGETGVFLATAHPAKFLPVYERLGIESARSPVSAGGVADRPIVAREMPADFGPFRQILT